MPVASLTPVVTTKNVSKHCQMSPSRQDHTYLEPQLYNITWRISTVPRIARGAKGLFSWIQFSWVQWGNSQDVNNMDTHVSLYFSWGFPVSTAETTSLFKPSKSFISVSGYSEHWDLIFIPERHFLRGNVLRSHFFCLSVCFLPSTT